MGRFRLICGVSVILISVSACGDRANPSPNHLTVAPASAASVAALEAKISTLQASLDRLRIDLISLKHRGPQNMVMFDPQDDKGYQTIMGPAGAMLAVLEKVEPYVDGFTVHMKIGNPTSAGFSGIKGTIRWGRQFDDKKNDTFNQLAEKTIELKDFLPAGAWTIVKFNIGPAAPDQVRRIVFAPQFDTIQLRETAR